MNPAQLNYANKRNIPFVVIVGSEEVVTKKFVLKNMQTGEQQAVDFDGLVGVFLIFD